MNVLEEIVFTKTLSIWRSYFDIKNKNLIVSECELLMKNKPGVKNDGYSYYLNGGLKYKDFLEMEINSELDKVMIAGLNSCIKIHNKDFNEIKTDVWVNVVRVNDPVQKIYRSNGNLIFHNHVDLNIQNKLPPPMYTFVCYIQMPNNLTGEDGVLYMEDEDKSVHHILPKEGEILIMNGDLPHVPNYAPNSSVDRIVLAGSVRMDLSKFNKSII